MTWCGPASVIMQSSIYSTCTYVISFDTEQLLYDYQANTKYSTIMRVKKLACLSNQLLHVCVTV